jgi:hypothetical protein
LLLRRMLLLHLHLLLTGELVVLHHRLVVETAETRIQHGIGDGAPDHSAWAALHHVRGETTHSAVHRGVVCEPAHGHAAGDARSHRRAPARAHGHCAGNHAVGTGKAHLCAGEHAHGWILAAWVALHGHVVLTGRWLLHEGGVVEADQVGGLGLAEHWIHEGVEVRFGGLWVQVRGP